MSTLCNGTRKMKGLSVLVILSCCLVVQCDSRIYFYYKPKISAAPTPDCRNSSTQWCEPDNYPSSAIKQILNRNVEITKYFDGKKQILIDTKYLSSYENVCDATSEYIYPKAAKSTDGDFMFIVEGLGSTGSW